MCRGVLMVRRFLVILAVEFWLGGFTFYASVVIHTGHRVFGSRLEVGFLTQQVTRWLNLSSVVGLIALLWNGLADWKTAKTWLRASLAVTWITMAVVQVALFGLHPVLDRMLDVETHQMLQRPAFHSVHKLYMNLSTLQWGAGLLHIWFVLLVWGGRDQLAGRVSPAKPIWEGDRADTGGPTSSGVVKLPSSFATFVESLHGSATAHWDHEPRRIPLTLPSGTLSPSGPPVGEGDGVRGFGSWEVLALFVSSYS
jgi:hypothetical protein